jgi:hypothetical protein
VHDVRAGVMIPDADAGHPDPDPDPEPVAPLEPAADECCGSGCVRCVFDIHEDARERYLIELAAWRARQSSKVVDSDMP